MNFRKLFLSSLLVCTAAIQQTHGVTGEAYNYSDLNARYNHILESEDEKTLKFLQLKELLADVESMTPSTLRQGVLVAAPLITYAALVALLIKSVSVNIVFDHISFEEVLFSEKQILLKIQPLFETKEAFYMFFCSTIPALALQTAGSILLLDSTMKCACDCFQNANDLNSLKSKIIAELVSNYQQ